MLSNWKELLTVKPSKYVQSIEQYVQSYKKIDFEHQQTFIET